MCRLCTRIVTGIRNKDTQKALLKEQNLELRKAIDICKPMEKADADATAMRPQETVEQLRTHTKSNKTYGPKNKGHGQGQRDSTRGSHSQSGPQKTCSWCGREGDILIVANKTQPLRQLLNKDTAWCWDHPQQTAFDNIKK
ncbi:hypothetical protein CAPTEDRAFT_213101 [Capitella teleta]|uniref:Uncharacterized protein n=1 Tax=Capitella teleta TaxID=283909 RepID=R7VIL8_CAPTE|nr:hypothetical protein CAPTEDRAFT_213101 [Capitella teleta]|eukprot:ELU18397.1 hypothetical protein CAPTEDRAFT_213101 [Capitella teleta]